MITFARRAQNQRQEEAGNSCLNRRKLSLVSAISFAQDDTLIAGDNNMQIRLGYELIYNFPQPTPMILALNIHYSRASDIIIPDFLTTDPAVPIGGYRDGFGNWCTRLVAPAGRVRIKTDALIRDNGQPDPVVAGAQQHAVQDLPEDTLVFLLGSRYCDTDLLSQVAWDRFGQSPQQGWARVQEICDFAHNRIKFDYNQARPTRTASEAFYEQTGVCRDYAHLAITLCRCLNIPARYCTGYLGDMGTPPPWGVGDFAAWFEVYLSGAWHIFDARNNVPRIGRVLLAHGRDASDVAIATTFGPNTLESFKVWTDEVSTLSNVSQA
jgi:transglutaminase-like putative cysteine protease